MATLDRFVPPALASLLADAANGRATSLAGVTPSALPLLTRLLPETLGRPLALVVATTREAEEIAQDGRFYAAIGGRPDNRPHVLPPLEPEPYLGVAPHLGVLVDRVLALAHASAARTRCIVLPAESLLLRMPPPEHLRQLVRRVDRGAEIERDEIVAQLITAGYRRQDMVGSIGEVAVRGGVLDVFSPAHADPYRIELFGDTVESIRAFDPVTQRSAEDLDHADLLPLTTFALPTDADRRLRVWGERLDEAQRESLRRKRDELRDTRTFAGIEYYAPVFVDALVPALSHLAGFTVAVVEPDAVLAAFEQARSALEHVHGEVVERGHAVPTPDELALSLDDVEQLVAAAPLHVSALTSERAPGTVARAELSLHTQPGRRYEGRIKDLVSDLKEDSRRGLDAVVVLPSEAEAERVEAMLSEYEVSYVEGERARALWLEGARPAAAGGSPQLGRVAIDTGRLAQGFRSPLLGVAVYTAPDVFGVGLPPARRKRRLGSAFASDFRDLKVGDHVVHVDHGVARFLGLKSVDAAGVTQEFMVLEYHGDDKLYVPLDRLDLVQKFSGLEGVRPKVDNLGGTSWAKAKTRVKAELRSMAAELLNLYASRRLLNGHSFAPDGLFQREFEDAFPFTETADQLTAIADLKSDMESNRCMDRLLCGDVGYGKTEVAMRAAFKAVADGKQVAVLAPTTVLTFQHYRTFKERFAAFPITVDMVSRFRTKKETDDVLARLADGKLDILIGTHRILSKDIEFRDLGVLIVDEEQRFGVAHKEKIKQLRKGVDVLTMSATPIPRTLQMALGGLRDMSSIQTPPRDRLAIETTVMQFNSEVIKEGIKRELERGGQVFFVHNRVESIHAMADTLHRIVPFARIIVGHGQMKEHELEKTMMTFIEHRADVLVATTIIENGIDMPNCNTIFINRAHRLGLAQLYQLRGRVGRSDKPAYAYLLTPARIELSPVARRRLHAIQEFSELGSGFRIAALDLEIRGAGDVLGRKQHGHITAVGFDMYMDLLDKTVRELKGEVVAEIQTQINLGVDIHIPQDYIADQNQRLMAYKKIAGARDASEVDDVGIELKDRFGPLPPAVEHLLEAGRLRLDAQSKRVVAIERDGRLARLRLGSDPLLDPQAIVRFANESEDHRVHPDGRIEFPVSPGADAIEEIRVVLAELSA